MKTTASDVEFDVVNLSGSTSTVAVDLDDLPDTALGESLRRVLRDVVDGTLSDIAGFSSAI
ncbi:FXSXX-COOH protein [Streptomyces sp. B3I7]|jgi:FXSXX-COOH protein|uniref:FxSxx-COOH cyclophane-containing RiPP peptide n=1 Tax=unclassified Streptomyces TaxID=2593676 RepID=UPI002784B30B|nr:MULTISPECIES: FxSxx-COOH cyclophane-containing RiPP peptide [unclassified Streptomyces]MDQ0791090.1 FXSXX-COOH protein [Streptomyces sp. B3I8]MDQ0809190.1 FXSXX-COOH protein [Streptomyces sp. B3I7]